MNKNLEIKLIKMEKILDEDFSFIDLLCIEKKDKNVCFDNCKSEIDFYYKLKQQYDYLRFAEIMFWIEEDTFREKQIYISMYNIQNPEEYLCIGEVEPYPLIINKKDGIVSIVLNEPGLDCDIREYCGLEEFMNKYVLGEKYLEIGSDDEWFEFIKEHNII